MNPAAQKYGAPSLASVNLVPKEIAERRTMRMVRMFAVVAVLAAIGLVVVGYLGALGVRALAQDDLNTAFGQQGAAFQTRDSMVPLYGEFADREQSEYTLAQVGWGEVDMSSFVVGIANQASGDGSSFTSITVASPSALGPNMEAHDSVFGAGVGSVSFNAVASSPEESTNLISRIEAVPGVASVRATVEQATTVEGEPYWSIEGVAVMTPTALTMRLIPDESLTGLTGENILQTLQGGEPEASPSPSPSPEPTATEEGEE